MSLKKKGEKMPKIAVVVLIILAVILAAFLAYTQTQLLL